MTPYCVVFAITIAGVCGRSAAICSGERGRTLPEVRVGDRPAGEVPRGKWPHPGVLDGGFRLLEEVLNQYRAEGYASRTLESYWSVCWHFLV